MHRFERSTARWIGWSLLFAFSPVHAQRNAEDEKLCFEQESHAEARACLEARSASSARAVRVAEAQLVDAIARSDQQDDDKRPAEALLAASAKSFTRWRQDQCDFQAALAFGGNGAGDRRLLCRIELDRRRVDALRAAMKSIH